MPAKSCDVVGMGYRCAPCSHKAEIARLTGGGDAGSHFTAGEREHLANAGMLTVLGGSVVILAGIGLAFIRLFLGIALVTGGISMIAVGFARRGAAR